MLAAERFEAAFPLSEWSWSVAEEVSDASVYTHGPGIDEPLSRENLTTGTVEYYHADGLGSIVKITSSTGAVLQTRQYDTYGNLEAGADQPGFAYTGREWDPETGLYYYRARYYDPRVGRFIGADPVGFTGGINFYAYAEGNPANLIDPLGLYSFDEALYDAAQFSAGFGDTLSLGLTSYARDELGTNDLVDFCSAAYGAGDWAGTGVGFGLGAGSMARGALAMGGRSGGLSTRFARGLGRFVSDPRTFSTVSKQYWGAHGGAGSMSLHHWAVAQRAGAVNAGWNLMELPGALNSWMGYSSAGRAFELGLRAAVPGSLAGGAAQGARWGITRASQQCGCR